MSGRVVWDIHAPAEGVNKQLNFTVKRNHRQLTTSTYCIFEAYFMIKSL